jgi:predicted lysophospholipase L1 biosynthesis ABC-type transport system permease subunit
MPASEREPLCLGGVALDAVVGAKAGVERRLERSPYGTVAAALGIGYVLGGGVFSPLTARALGLGLRLGLRLVVLPILTEQLVGFVQDATTRDALDEPFARRPLPSRNGGASPPTGI